MSDATSLSLIGVAESSRRKVEKHARSFEEVARAWKYKVIDKLTNSEALLRACADFKNVPQEGAVPESEGGNPGSIMNHYKKRIQKAIQRALKSGTVNSCPFVKVLKKEGVVS